MQVPSSWGQAWSTSHWQEFKVFFEAFDYVYPLSAKIPENVMMWPDKSSWKKIFFYYMIEKDLFFVYNNISLSTNCGDEGIHFGSNTTAFQTFLLYGSKDLSFEFTPFKESLNKYDAFMEILPESLKKLGFNPKDNFVVDMYGVKQLALYNEEYALSIKDLKCERKFQSFDANFLPLVNNIIFKSMGEIFNYAPKKEFVDQIPEKKQETLVKLFGGESYSYINRKLSLFFKNTKYYKIGFYIMHPKKLIRSVYNKVRF